jgi:riboflavin synthase
MFTGIVQATGRIDRVEPLGEGAGVRLRVRVEPPFLADALEGDSICVSGVCLTATSLSSDAFTVDVSLESLSRTAGLDAPRAVNLEKSLRLGDKLGGHLVFGHVDGVAEVVRLDPAGESLELVLRAPPSLARYLAFKGSVSVDGVSLTVNRVTDAADGCEISINLIPHTLASTTLRQLRAGARVNLEVDMIARYVERMLHGRATPGLGGPGAG